ncbi:MAG: SDR family oxidoreductase [Candidatus Stygibacter frigidus]|nr:SDR family oxidoreductase [Candidatus Stygibacter frigidus]
MPEIKNNEMYLLTGATGFLGSHIMAELLLKEKKVVITGRASKNESLKQRIQILLHWFGIAHLEEMLEFYETDFLKTRLGLDIVEYDDLCTKNLTIIHCASDTSFAEKNRKRVMKSNVDNLTEILNFALNSRTPCFHFISTAYAVGTDIVESPEVPVNSTHFTNVYEESKAYAENIVSFRCREHEIPFTIIRPSIVYGNSISGRSLKFNALYYPVRFLQYIKDIYLNDIKNNGGGKSTKNGIYLNDKGVLHLPLRIFIPNEGKINLIPVDYFTATFFSIIENPGNETFFHITSNTPKTMVKLASYTERFLNITGIEIVIGASDKNELRNPTEELFDHFIKVYRPYISDKRVFIRQNTDQATNGDLPPDFTYEIFNKCMSFADSVDWGKNLFT